MSPVPLRVPRKPPAVTFRAELDYQRDVRRFRIECPLRQFGVERPVDKGLHRVVRVRQELVLVPRHHADEWKPVGLAIDLLHRPRWGIGCRGSAATNCSRNTPRRSVFPPRSRNPRSVGRRPRPPTRRNRGTPRGRFVHSAAARVFASGRRRRHFGKPATSCRSTSPSRS